MSDLESRIERIESELGIGRENAEHGTLWLKAIDDIQDIPRYFPLSSVEIEHTPEMGFEYTARGTPRVDPAGDVHGSGWNFGEAEIVHYTEVPGHE